MQCTVLGLWNVRASVCLPYRSTAADERWPALSLLSARQLPTPSPLFFRSTALSSKCGQPCWHPRDEAEHKICLPCVVVLGLLLRGQRTEHGTRHKTVECRTVCQSCRLTARRLARFDAKVGRHAGSVNFAPTVRMSNVLVIIIQLLLFQLLTSKSGCINIDSPLFCYTAT